MRWLFSFRGTVGRGPFAVAALIIFFIPHAAIATLLWKQAGRLPPLTGEFLLWPLRWIFERVDPIWSVGPPMDFGANSIFVAAGLLTVVGSWSLTALASRRTADARLNGWVSLLTITPLIQIPVLLALALWPSRPPSVSSTVEARTQEWAAAAKGVLLATGLTLIGVAVGAMVFKSYGYWLFVLSPVLIGAIAAYSANRRTEITWGGTLVVVTMSLLVGGFSLIAFALEGAVCLVMASPLAFVMALIGAGFGRAIALDRRGNTLHSFALLPLLFLSEQASPPTIHFADTLSVEVAATPDEIWPAVLHMDAITAKPSLPFRLGVAYPVHGEVTGEGVGAVRRGYFSTGVAVEHVTEWTPGKALGFDIIAEPPSMHELSPYKHVHAPHVDGFFRSIHARISIEEIGPGKSRLTLATSHELDVQPGFYWLPMAEWVVRQNKSRVLTQMRSQAEALHVAAK